MLYDGALFILSASLFGTGDMVQVVVLDDDLLTGTRAGMITDSDMDGVASGGMHGDSLYVNNARYGAPPGDTAQWITKLNIYDVH